MAFVGINMRKAGFIGLRFLSSGAAKPPTPPVPASSATKTAASPGSNNVVANKIPSPSEQIPPVNIAFSANPVTPKPITASQTTTIITEAEVQALKAEAAKKTAMAEAKKAADAKMVANNEVKKAQELAKQAALSQEIASKTKKIEEEKQTQLAKEKAAALKKIEEEKQAQLAKEKAAALKKIEEEKQLAKEKAAAEAHAKKLEEKEMMKSNPLPNSIAPPSIASLPSSPVGPGASKEGAYKNPEYYTYNVMSFYDIENDMKSFRIPQPSSLKK